MTKLIIFDLDGTLLNTIEDLANSVNHALSIYGFAQHKTEEYNFMVGNGVNNLLKRALPADLRENADVNSMIRNEFIKHYFANADKCTKPYNGMVELLKMLERQGFMLAVASNKVHDATVALVTKFFPETHFVEIIGQRDGAPVKPNPAIVEEIIAKAGVKKSETLYVGDSGVDVQTAANADVRFVGVLWGFRPRVELESFGATEFVETAEDLMKVFYT
ncbi:MAG: HAD family hydrolase [Paludibacter sp.]|jgi:phosphoglycolate phosphatase|nr:HAD family hydrolase [Paludibacter sp.]